MFDGLFDTIVRNVGLSKVVVRYDQPEVRFAVIEHKELIKGQFLDFDVD